ncbi:hypothetical protein EYF80_000363 [Liparis tanakae]|uniref:Uncharacterized protein n=1 Tax=Liparis tanakae TaxID=230148 RepID=A0A4Z2JFP6_9TELE|nr:hypothetical protein EYF80_000363 [Liparis tanakae]
MKGKRSGHDERDKEEMSKGRQPLSNKGQTCSHPTQLVAQPLQPTSPDTGLERGVRKGARLLAIHHTLLTRPQC